MATTIVNNVNNGSQSNAVPLIINITPSVLPEDLIWNVGPGGLTQNGTPGTIFSTIHPDQTTPYGWYFKGNSLIDNSSIKTHDTENIILTNSSTELISGSVEKGLFEMRQGNPYPINLIIQGTTTTISITNHGFTSSNIGTTLLLNVNSSIIPSGIYRVCAIIDANTLEVDYDSSSVLSPSFISGTSTQFEYRWDEVYTTPIGLKTVRDESVSPVNINEFKVYGGSSSNSGNGLTIGIEDPNIIPQIGDSLVVQHFYNSNTDYTILSTTNAFNSVKNYTETETYTFIIQSVVAIPQTGYIEYQLTLDKSFKPINPGTALEKYIFVLLNRDNTAVNKNLYNDTWQLTEVHREQLLGDPYNYTGSLNFKGRKNYLNYAGADMLGVSTLLDGIITDKKTPYTVLSFSESIKDRLDESQNEFEVHFPCVMLQGEQSSVVLVNNTTTINKGELGEGKFAPLYLKYPSNPSMLQVRYGWVFFDLRLVVIDHPELVTALGYNSNRNYTLPKPKFSNQANTFKNYTKLNPIKVLAVSNANTTPIKVTTDGNHNLTTGDKVYIQGVQGNLAANSPAGGYYASVVSQNEFALFSDSILTLPVSPASANDNYTLGGETWSDKLEYEHFLTYRLLGKHYDTLPYSETVPFNFQLGNIPSQSTSATLEVEMDKLTHLVDANKALGFEAEYFQLIVGSYVKSLSQPYKIENLTNIVYLKDPLSSNPGKKLKDTSNVQNLNHQILITRAYYNATVSAGTQSYDLKNNLNSLIYDGLTSIPQDLFTGRNTWNIGVVKYRQKTTQYRLNIQVTLPTDKWNATLNPTYEDGNEFMMNKLISEIEFLIQDETGEVVDLPWIYSKISPPIKKTNQNEITISIDIDF